MKEKDMFNQDPWYVPGSYVIRREFKSLAEAQDWRRQVEHDMPGWRVWLELDDWHKCWVGVAKSPLQ